LSGWVSAADQCPVQLMTGIVCNDDGSQSISSKSVSSADACCAECSSTANCGAFTYQRGTCQLKTYCRNAGTGGGWLRNNGTGGGWLRDDESTSAISGVFPTGKPAPFCSGPNMYLGKGYRCNDATLETVSVTDETGCCDACQKNAQCGYYSYSTSQRTCELKNTCTSKKKSSGYNTGFVPPADSPSKFEYNVGMGSFEYNGYECGREGPQTLVFYPEGQGPFNVALYAHGLGGYLDHGTSSTMDGLDEWMKTVASIGFIVIVPFGSPGSCGTEYIDMLNVLNYSKANSPHPVFAKANWSGVGVWGHSMGASAAPRVAHHGPEYGINVLAQVASHGGASSKLVHVPSLYTTGTLDTKDADHTAFESQYDECKGRPKVFVDLKDGYHMEPLEGKRLNYLTTRFLGCHVQGRQDFCNYIYEGDLCSRSELTKCRICLPGDEGDCTAPPTPPTPPSPPPTPTPSGCSNHYSRRQCQQYGCEWCGSSFSGSCKASCNGAMSV